MEMRLSPARCARHINPTHSFKEIFSMDAMYEEKKERHDGEKSESGFLEVINQHDSISSAYKQDLDLLSAQMQFVAPGYIKDLGPQFEGAQWHEWGLISRVHIDELQKMGVGSQFKTRRVFGKKLSELCNSTKMVADSLMAPPNEGGFSLIWRSFYDPRTGYVTLKFNADEKKRVYGLTVKFTPMNVKAVLSLRSAGAIHLYMELASEYNRMLSKSRDPKTADIRHDITYNLVQLRMMIGMNLAYDNPNSPLMKELRKENPDFDRIKKLLPEENLKYAEWGDLKRRLLDPLVSAINAFEGHDFLVEMTPVASGASHRTEAVTFTLMTNTDTAKHQYETEAAKLQEWCRCRISRTQAYELIRLADGDVKTVMKAYKLAEDHGRSVDNWFAYLKAVIVEGATYYGRDEFRGGDA